MQRSWPRGLAVTVIEQQAVARWNSTDLVNAHGDLFSGNAHFVPPELPQLAGPPGTEADVVARYLARAGPDRGVGRAPHARSSSMRAAPGNCSSTTA